MSNKALRAFVTPRIISMFIITKTSLYSSCAVAQAFNEPQPYVPPPSFLQLNKLELINQHKESVLPKEDGFYEFKTRDNKLLAKYKHPYFTFNLSYEKRQVDPQTNKPNATTTSSGVNGDTYQLNIGKINRMGGNKTNFYTGYGVTMQYNQFKILNLSINTPSVRTTNNKLQALYGGMYIQMSLLSTFNKKLYNNTQLFIAALVGQNKYTLESESTPRRFESTTKLSYSAQAGLLINQDIKKFSLLTLGVKARANVAGIHYEQFLDNFKAEKIQLVCNGNARLAFKFNLSPLFYYSIAPGYQYDCPNKLKYDVLPSSMLNVTSITATQKDDTGFMLTSEIALIESIRDSNSFRFNYTQTPETSSGTFYYSYRFQ